MAMYDVYQALTQSFIDLGLGLKIVTENADEDPNGTEIYVYLDFLPSEVESMGKKETDSDQNFGSYQVSLYAPSGTSTGDIQEYADTILAFYRHNRAVTSVNGQVVTIENSNRNGGRNNSGWYVIDITINYKTDIERN